MNRSTTEPSGAGTEPHTRVIAVPADDDPDTLADILARQRAAFLRQGPPSARVRRDRIDRLISMVLDNREAFTDALSRDFGTRSRTGILFAEIMGMLSSLEHTRANLDRWMRPHNPSRAARLIGVRAEVQPSPLGVVGIIGPWNFPLGLVVWPAVSAFAAGNRVMIKMSEVTSHTARLTKALADDYFDRDVLAVVTGGPDVAAAFANLRLDHIFFTGSTRVGRLVMQAAAANLVPVTLELGGKNPVVVAPDADIARAARRIARSRMVNGGQVCVCPDYVLVPEHLIEEFTAAVRAALAETFPDIIANDDYTSSVDDANYDRVLALVDDARARGARVESVEPAGEVLPDRRTRKIAPTVVRDVTDDMAITREEIFGPVLVIRPYLGLGAAIDHVNERPAPLVAYWFGPDGPDFRTFVRHTRSGGVSRNDFGMNMFPVDAPFGGVGHSGMGAYHGKAGFDTFSHRRTVVGSDLPWPITSVAAPPFSGALRALVDFTLRTAHRRSRSRIAKSTY
ncbi:aldehyde dehydrogenase family protein [Nocardia sp. NPDC057668]|uniref:aldehyde dehydrogenase family protein n=1 Tax=Nocardia sp. NPDC057668 TaxID=3346202 RepID=UPI00366A8CA3